MENLKRKIAEDYIKTMGFSGPMEEIVASIFKDGFDTGYAAGMMVLSHREN